MSRTKAKFTNKIKLEILERDNNQCALCDNGALDIHHIYFGLQSEYGEFRNNKEKGISLCRSCHDKCHSCKSGNGIREDAINYIVYKKYLNKI